MLRHGQSEWNALRRWQGAADIALTELGRTQARATADRLASLPTAFARAWTSDLIRASQRVQAENRRIALNALRANPKLCGLSLTGQTDSCMVGEGLTTIWREPKAAMVETLGCGRGLMFGTGLTAASSINGRWCFGTWTVSA